jgi:hypothetical protein
MSYAVTHKNRIGLIFVCCVIRHVGLCKYPVSEPFKALKRQLKSVRNE